MRSLPILVAGALAVTLTGPPTAQAGSYPQDLTSYLNRTPTVVGSVTASDEHSVTLTTDSGSPMKLVVDSRSVIPAELPAGSRVRVQFNALGTDAFHAQRITPLTAGEIRALDEQSQPRMRASMESDEGSSAGASDGAAAEPGSAGSSPTAQSRSEYAPSSAQQSDTEASATQSTSEVAPSSERPASEGETAGSEGEAERLPRASSSLPLIGALGLLAIVAGVGFGLMRRRRA